MTRRLLTAFQAAEVLGVCENTVYNLIAKGALPVVSLPLGRSKSRIDMKDLEAFIQARKRSD